MNKNKNKQPRQRGNTTNNFYAPVGQYIEHVDKIEAHFDKDMGMQVKNANDKEETPEPDADEIKRQKLLISNTIVRLNTQTGKPGVDLLKLYRFIDRYFVSEISKAYEWYALRRFLEKYHLLRECNNEEFAAQMNHAEWFAHAEKKCQAKEMNTYNFLNSVMPDKWTDTSTPVNSKATLRSLSNIYKKYQDLELYRDILMDL